MIKIDREQLKLYSSSIADKIVKIAKRAARRKNTDAMDEILYGTPSLYLDKNTGEVHIGTIRGAFVEILPNMVELWDGGSDVDGGTLRDVRLNLGDETEPTTPNEAREKLAARILDMATEVVGRLEIVAENGGAWW